MGSTVPEVIARAKQLIAERKHQEAVRACRRVLLARPDEGAVRLLLGQALLALNRHDEVRLEMLSLIKKTPDSAAAHRLLGEARMRLGRREKAKEALTAALKLDPSDDEARDLLEELGAAAEDLPPEMGTIDRWFADEKTEGDHEEDEEDEEDEGLEPLEGEATTASVALPESFDDRTAGDPRVHTGPSIQLDPELEKASEELAVPPSSPPRPIPSPGAAMPSPSAPPRAPAPKAPRAPAPKAPRAPAPKGAGPKPKRKATLLGMAAVAPSPGAPIPPPGKAGPRSNPPPPPGRAPTGGFDTGAAEPGAPLDERTAELSLDDLAPISGTSELEVGDLQPLAGEATSQLDTADLESAEAGLPGVPMDPSAPDFNDETTRGAKRAAKTPPGESPEVAPSGVAAPPGRGFQDEASIDGTTEARPRVDGFDFPSDDIDTGLPPLEGEATAAREAPIPEPIAPPPSSGPPGAAPPGFSPAPLPGGGLEPSATPMSSPSRAVPTERPPPPAAGPIVPPTDTDAAVGKKRFDFGERWDSLKDTVSGWRTKLETAITERTGSDEVPTRVWIALAGIPVLLLVMLIALIRVFGSSGAEEEARIAARTAADDGLLASLNAALALEAEEELDGPAALARQGWLNAVAAYEHGLETEGAAEGALNRLAVADRGQALARIARTYLALERGAVEEAAALSETLQPTDVAGEGAYAKAMVALARGQTAAAVEQARRSQTARPNAARYAALLARVMAAQGESEPALQLTSGVTGAEASPVVRLARVEAHAANDDWDASLQEAEAVIGPLADRASERQRAWAHLGAARALAGKGEDERAREMLAAAVESRPTASEAYGLGLAEVFLAIGSPQDARTFVDTLPEEVASAHQRAAISAEVFLAQDDLEALEAVLESAADSPRTAFLRGRLAEAEDDLDAAKRFYEAASADDESRAESLLRLGAIALKQDRLEDAIDRLQGAVEAAPSNAEAVATLARAHLEDDDADEALEVIERGLEASPDDPTILIARAEVELAADQPEAAMRTLESLVEQRPNDADLHAALGEAARRMGSYERAATAYDKALELRPGDESALLGKVQLAIAQQDLEAATAAVEAAEEGGVEGRAMAVAKARVMVLEGRGREAAQALRRLVRRRSRDADLLAAYGWAQAQAEDYRDAKRTFARALRADEDEIEAHLGMALVETRLGDLRGALRAVGEAERIVRAKDLGDRYVSRVAVARGRVRFEYGSFSDAKEHAEEAVEKDEKNAAAHFLLAMIADATSGEVEPHLRRAAEGRMPPPEVFGQLVIHMGGGSERCELGRRYLRAAPRGIDARDVRRLTRRCR